MGNKKNEGSADAEVKKYKPDSIYVNASDWSYQWQANHSRKQREEEYLKKWKQASTFFMLIKDILLTGCSEMWEVYPSMRGFFFSLWTLAEIM